MEKIVGKVSEIRRKFISRYGFNMAMVTLCLYMFLVAITILKLVDGLKFVFETESIGSNGRIAHSPATIIGWLVTLMLVFVLDGILMMNELFIIPFILVAVPLLIAIV